MLIKNIVDSLPRHPTRKWKKRKLSQITRIVIHTTGSNNQDPFRTNSYHITPGANNHLSKRGAPHLAYTLFIDKEGTTYLCNNWEDITWHCGLWNTSSIGVVMAFRGEISTEAPTTRQYDSLEKALLILCLKFNINPDNIFGHREVPGMYTILGNGSRRLKKVCPGLQVNLDQLRHDITIRLQCLLVTRLAGWSFIPTGIWSLDWQKALEVHSSSLYKDGNYQL